MTGKKSIPEGFSKLTVIVGDSSNFYLNNVVMENSDSSVNLSLEYDTIRKKLIYVCDSLKNSEYDLILNSVLNRKFVKPITLISDTTVYINKSELPAFDTLNRLTGILTDFQVDDTICIGYISSGCFHNYSNKTIIYRKDGNFIAEFTTDTSHDYKKSQILSLKSKLPSSFSDTLKQLELACMAGLVKQLAVRRNLDKQLVNAKDMWDSSRMSMIWFSSTTSSSIFINKGNRVFELTNNAINEIPYYDRFMSALKLK